MVECLPSKQVVASSSLVVRSIIKKGTYGTFFNDGNFTTDTNEATICCDALAVCENISLSITDKVCADCVENQTE